MLSLFAGFGGFWSSRPAAWRPRDRSELVWRPHHQRLERVSQEGSALASFGLLRGRHVESACRPLARARFRILRLRCTARPLGVGWRDGGDRAGCGFGRELREHDVRVLPDERVAREHASVLLPPDPASLLGSTSPSTFTSERTAFTSVGRS